MYTAQEKRAIEKHFIDNPYCLICGQEASQVHHVLGKKHQIYASLCAKCHDIVEFRDVKGYSFKIFDKLKNDTLFLTTARDKGDKLFFEWLKERESKQCDKCGSLMQSTFVSWICPICGEEVLG